jgi:hypothetical protein
MQPRTIVIRRHAIFKRQYRRVVHAVPDFHTMPPETQWSLLRAQVFAEAITGRSALLQTLDQRATRRDEVLAGLEAGRRHDLTSGEQPRA